MPKTEQETIRAYIKQEKRNVQQGYDARLRFAILKGTLIGLRGFCGKWLMRQDEVAVGSIDFNLIPQEKCYENIATMTKNE